MGGGRAYFTPEAVLDPETGAAGRRLDGVNLIDEWKTAHPNGAYVTNIDELNNVAVATTDSLLGESCGIEIITEHILQDI